MNWIYSWFSLCICTFCVSFAFWPLLFAQFSSNLNLIYIFYICFPLILPSNCLGKVDDISTKFHKISLSKLIMEWIEEKNATFPWKKKAEEERSTALAVLFFFSLSPQVPSIQTHMWCLRVSFVGRGKREWEHVSVCVSRAWESSLRAGWLNCLLSTLQNGLCKVPPTVVDPFTRLKEKEEGKGGRKKHKATT